MKNNDIEDLVKLATINGIKTLQLYLLRKSLKEKGNDLFDWIDKNSEELLEENDYRHSDK